jgi:hypothetical protein
LDCYAGGDTVYRRFEHGSLKEHAVLYANGTCKYDIKACRADYAPFVALRAKVLPIKARPRTSAPTAACMPPFFRQPSPPSRSHRPLFWHSQELATTHADMVRTCRLRHQPPPSACMGLVAQQLPNKCTARPTWTTHRAGRVHHACDTNHMCSAPLPPSRARRAAQWALVRLRLFRHVRHALVERCDLRRAAHVGVTPQYAARTPPTRVAVAFRTVHLHSGPISRTKLRCAFDAPIISDGF